MRRGSMKKRVWKSQRVNEYDRNWKHTLRERERERERQWRMREGVDKRCTKERERMPTVKKIERVNESVWIRERGLGKADFKNN